LPWQGAQLFAKIFAASSVAAGVGARTRLTEKAARATMAMRRTVMRLILQ
jgi:hypothetical protein